MLFELAQKFSGEIASISLVITLISAALHIIFAGAVARDAGQLTKVGKHPLLVSGLTWSFAALIGGVFVAAIYWLLHHSTLTTVSQTRTTETRV